MGLAGGEVPQVTLRDIIHVGAAPLVENRDPAAAVGHVAPFRCDMPMQLPDAAGATPPAAPNARTLRLDNRLIDRSPCCSMLRPPDAASAGPPAGREGSNLSPAVLVVFLEGPSR